MKYFLLLPLLFINITFADTLDDELDALEDELNGTNTVIEPTERDIFMNEEIGKSLIRTQYGAIVEAGKVVENAILADAMGIIFIEFPMHTRVRIKNGPATYSGLIKRPTIIDTVDSAPKGGYTTLLTFALESDSEDDLQFTDRFAGLSNRELLKLKYSTEKVNIKRKNGATLILLLPEGVGKAALYRYNTDDIDTRSDDKKTDKKDNRWVRIGGIMKAVDDNKTVFKAPLSRTGVYAIIDESPLPYYPTTYIGNVDLAKITKYESPEIPEWYHYAEDVLRIGEVLGEYTPEKLEAEIASSSADIDDIDYPRLPNNEEISTTPPTQLVERVENMNTNNSNNDTEISFIAGVDSDGNAIEMAAPDDAMTLRERLIKQLRDRAEVNSNDFESAEIASDTGGVGTGTPLNTDNDTLIKALPETGNSVWIVLSTLVLGALIGVITWYYNTDKRSI